MCFQNHGPFVWMLLGSKNWLKTVKILTISFIQMKVTSYELTASTVCSVYMFHKHNASPGILYGYSTGWRAFNIFREKRNPQILLPSLIIVVVRLEFIDQAGLQGEPKWSASGQIFSWLHFLSKSIIAYKRQSSNMFLFSVLNAL